MYVCYARLVLEQGEHARHAQSTCWRDDLLQPDGVDWTAALEVLKRSSRLGESSKDGGEVLVMLV